MAVRPVTRPLLSTIAVGFECPINVAGDEQVEIATIVVIEKARAGAPPTAANARLLCDIRECPISVVMVENVATEAGDVDIIETVIVVIAHSHAHRVVALRRSAEASPFGHIRECAVGILVIQAVPEFLVRLVRKLALGHWVVD